MEDIQLILYILAAVAYFLFMQWRKAFKGPDDVTDAKEQNDKSVARRQVSQSRPQHPPRPVTSFEDILRELKPKAEQARQEERTAYEAVQEELRQQPELQPAPVVEESRRYRSYEGAAPRVFSWEKPAEALEMTKQAKFRQQQAFAPYTSAPALVSSYARLLRNPASVREAVILSEILNRKYN